MKFMIMTRTGQLVSGINQVLFTPPRRPWDTGRLYVICKCEDSDDREFKSRRGVLSDYIFTATWFPAPFMVGHGKVVTKIAS